MHQSVASTCLFAEICELLEALSPGRFKPVKRHELLAKFISLWRQKHKQLHGESQTDDSFFPAMRILLPNADRERGPYGFKEHILAKKLIDVLVMDKKGSDAQLLLNYQSPKQTNKPGTISSRKDFATIASDILKYRIDKKSNMTLQEVDDRLENIAQAHATGNKSSIEKELEFFCRNAAPTELKWIIRLLLKDMKIGVQDITVFKEYHPEAALLYDATTSLRQVCEKLRDPNQRLDVIELNLFSPFRFMLANRSEPQNVAKIMYGQDFFVEVKYDGERCQLHKSGNVYKYFSRNGNDLTASYGETPDAGSITPFIHDAFRRSVANCILDGEMVGWNPDAKIIATKVDHFDVKALNDQDFIKPCFVAFDCLLLNDKVLTLEPLYKRLEILREVFDPIEGRLLEANRSIKSTTEDVIECLDHAIERREEGIVIKRKDSSYRLNARSNEAGWLKIKPDYVDEVCDNLDLVIIGGYFGDCRLSNLMSHFLLAVGDGCSGESSSAAPDRFISVCKVGSGYSAKELYDLNIYLNEKCILSRKKAPDTCQLGTEKPDVFIDPKNSKILQVKAPPVKRFSSYSPGMGRIHFSGIIRFTSTKMSH